MSRLLLYHSFPRPGNPVSKGIEQMELMIDCGILLTPEILSIPLRNGASDEFRQTRTSFTLIAREELWTPMPAYGQQSPGSSHAKQFGDFAIGIDPIRARSFGMGPVKYIYRAGAPSATNITIELLRNLWELRALALTISMMEWKAKSDGHKPIPPGELRALEGHKPIPVEELRALEQYKEVPADKLPKGNYYTSEIEEKWEAIEKSRKESILDALNYLDFVRKPAWSLADSINLALCFYQLADDSKSGKALRNFQLREWRIPQFSDGNVSIIPLRLTAHQIVNEKTRLRLIDVRRRLQKFGFEEKFLDQCAIFEGVRDINFFSFVEEVICPACVSKQIGRLLDGLGFYSFEESRNPDGIELAIFQRRRNR